MISEHKRFTFQKKLAVSVGNNLNIDNIQNMALLAEGNKPIAVINTDVSDLPPGEAISTLSSELLFMTRLKDKFVKNLNDTRKRLVYTEEEARKAVESKAKMEKKLDDFHHELSDCLKDKEFFMEEIERLKRQNKQMTIIYQEKDLQLDSLEVLKGERDSLQVKLKELEQEKLKVETSMSKKHS
jgi:chromosome segregation ATPase